MASAPAGSPAGALYVFGSGTVRGVGELRIGMSFPRVYPAGAVTEFAEALEERGVDQLWVIEDCFYTAGISLGATALARTSRLQVGIGILPVVARNPAISAMEIATLAELAPGRLLAGMGHGVQEWMGQMGAKAKSPLTALEETISIVRRLLAGENLTFDGRMHHMDHVELAAPPAIVPPVLAGVRQVRSLAAAGRCADGLVLAEGAGPNYIRWAVEHAAPEGDFHVSVFSALSIENDARTARANIAPFLAELLGSPNPALDRHSHIDEMREVYTERGIAGLTDMPGDWWTEFGAVGTLDDAVSHVEQLRDSGADNVSLFPAPELEIGREQLHDVARLRSAVRR